MSAPEAIGAPIVPPSWSAENDLAYSFFGFSVASAGDINGDGYGDVVVGTMPVPGAESGRGRLYLYYGSESGLASAPGWTFETQAVRSFFAFHVFPAGDVNGDGYGDIIVNEPRAFNGTGNEPRVYAFYGSAAGPGEVADWTVAGQEGMGFAWSIAPAGDVNGDGFSDVAVGEHGTAAFRGRVHVYHGSIAGLATTASLTVVSDQDFSFFGRSVAGAGDVNGDTYDDLIVGEPGYSTDRGMEGRIHVYFGSESGLITTAPWTAVGGRAEALIGEVVAGAGDVNGDGYSDIMARLANYDGQGNGDMEVHLFYGSPTAMSTTADWSSRNSHGRFTRAVPASAGDVNGDGYGDVLIGGRRYDNGSEAALVYYGSSAGLSATAGRELSDGQDSSSFGMSVASAGDVDNNGAEEIIIGAPLYDNGQENEGRVVVYYGETATGVDDAVASSPFAAILGTVVQSGGPLVLDVQTERAGVLHVQIVGVPGSALVQHSVEIGTGGQRVEIPLPATLSTGRYFVRLATAEGRTVVLPFGVVAP